MSSAAEDTAAADKAAIMAAIMAAYEEPTGMDIDGAEAAPGGHANRGGEAGPGPSSARHSEGMFQKLHSRRRHEEKIGKHFGDSSGTSCGDDGGAAENLANTMAEDCQHATADAADPSPHEQSAKQEWRFRPGPSANAECSVEQDRTTWRLFCKDFLALRRALAVVFARSTPTTTAGFSSAPMSSSPSASVAADAAAAVAAGKAVADANVSGQSSTHTSAGAEVSGQCAHAGTDLNGHLAGGHLVAGQSDTDAVFMATAYPGSLQAAAGSGILQETQHGWPPQELIHLALVVLSLTEQQLEAVLNVAELGTASNSAWEAVASASDQVRACTHSLRASRWHERTEEERLQMLYRTEADADVTGGATTAPWPTAVAPWWPPVNHAQCDAQAQGASNMQAAAEQAAGQPSNARGQEADGMQAAHQWDVEGRGEVAQGAASVPPGQEHELGLEDAQAAQNGMDVDVQDAFVDADSEEDPDFEDPEAEAAEAGGGGAAPVAAEDSEGDDDEELDSEEEFQLDRLEPAWQRRIVREQLENARRAARRIPGGGVDSNEDWDAEVEVFSEDSDDEMDTSAEQLEAGKDLQGIPWSRLQFTRDGYRQQRLEQYQNYTNVLPQESASLYKEALRKACKPVHPCTGFYGFVRNSRTVHSSIVHFQLRNLVWALSRNDVYVVCDNVINHWNPVARRVTPELDLSGGIRGARLPGVGRVQVSTMCVKEGLIAAGGFTGELVVKRLGQPGLLHCGRVTHNENGITNGIEVFVSRTHGTSVMTSNNDCFLRVHAANDAAFACTSRIEYEWAVNYATIRPGSNVAAVVGDDPVTYLTDIDTGTTVAKLAGHKDFSFAAAWHPSGNLLATGNQDTTVIVWDVRHTSEPVAMLPGRIGAIRSLRFSPDGAFLAVSEPADFVHLYDVASSFSRCQHTDFFGEIAGISFTPHSDAFFIAVADQTYSSLMQFERLHGNPEAALWSNVKLEKEDAAIQKVEDVGGEEDLPAGHEHDAADQAGVDAAVADAAEDEADAAPFAAPALAEAADAAIAAVGAAAAAAAVGAFAEAGADAAEFEEFVAAEDAHALWLLRGVREAANAAAGAQHAVAQLAAAVEQRQAGEPRATALQEAIAAAQAAVNALQAGLENAQGEIAGPGERADEGGGGGGSGNRQAVA